MSETQVIDHDAVQTVEPPRASRAVANRSTGTAVAIPDPMDLMKIALNKGASLEVITQLNQLRMAIEADTARKAFNLALAAAKKELRPIVRNRRVKFESSRADVKDGNVDYAHEDMAGIAEQIDHVLSAHGLSYYHDSLQPAPGQLTIICVITHELGHSKPTPLTAGIDLSGAKNHLQGIGSAATYLQRYTLKLALGLSVTDDDDANGTGNGVGQSPNRAPPAATQQQRPPRASQQQQQPTTGPRLLAPTAKGESYADWALRYIEAFKTADTVEDVKLWDKLNDEPLGRMFNDPKGRPTYDEVRAAWMKHGQMLAAKTTVGGTTQQATQAANQQQAAQDEKRNWGAPIILNDYEGFLKWATEKMRSWPKSDADLLENFWNEAIEPVSKEIMPPDKDDLMGEYRRAEQRLEG